ncbi:MAG TPA: phage terminase large subunit family protein [Acidobacteriaceae bacterium]
MKPFVCSDESRQALQVAIAVGLNVFRPKPPMTLSVWADEHAYIPAGSANPGKFSTSIAEYEREPMDIISDPHYRKVVLVWASQTGKTQLGLNALGYFSHQEPSYMLMIQPTLDRAQEISKTRIAPMIRDSPVLRALFPDPKSRDSGNTLELKEFPGGFLSLVGANSPSGLASKAIRFLYADEVDRFPESAGTEGDVLDLAYVRLSTFWNRIAVETSTPLIKGTSRIEHSFSESDQRFYMVPCPHCGLEQVLMWPRLKFTKETTPSGQTRPTAVWYDCVNDCRIEESSKYEMVRRGRWQASAESRDGRTAGFHLNALYSPWVEWTDLILEWLSAQADPEKLQVFTNTRLVESWELRGEGAEETELEKRQEILPTVAELPEGVLLLTIGVDVQRDRIVASLVGWGQGKEGWIVDHFILRGSPALPEENPDSPWRQLDELRERRWKHPSGKMLRVSCTCVDSGDQTKIVYDYTRRRERERVYAVKGADGFGRPLVNGGTRPDKNKTLLYLVGVDTAKERIYSGLQQKTPGAGYIHILKAEHLDREYLAELTSEHIITSRKRGRAVKHFELLAGRRNEALDCAVYASAAREILRPNFPKLYERIFGRPPLPPELTPLVDALKTVAEGVRQAFKEETKEPIPAPENAGADPFANLPIIGSFKKVNPVQKPASWRDSWEIG